MPGMLYKWNKSHFDRIDAIDYTLHHDDGCRGDYDHRSTGDHYHDDGSTDHHDHGGPTGGWLG